MRRVIHTNNDSVVVVRQDLGFVRTGELAETFPERVNATIHYPLIQGLSNQAVLKKIRSALKLKNIFGYTLAEYKEDAWLEEFDYVINFNRNFILDITFTQSGAGAYPDTHQKHFAFNLKTGDIIKADDVFNLASLPVLAKANNDRLESEIKKLFATQNMMRTMILKTGSVFQDTLTT